MGSTDDSKQLLHFNGVNGATGEYGMPSMNGETMMRFLQGETPPEELSELRWRQREAQQTAHFGVEEGIDSKDLAQSGWGIILTADADPAILEALTPLLELRQRQAGELFKLCHGADGYRPNESKSRFTRRWKAGPGPVKPQKLPYYLMIVGNPQQIPYRFQSRLSVQYAVGRIHFDSLDDYASYAETVIRSETDKPPARRKVTLFGVQNSLDRATQTSARQLIRPLSDQLTEQHSRWQIESLIKEQTHKADLCRILEGPEVPSVLLTASHGMEFPNGDSRQLCHQGALLCQDWPGPSWRQAIPQDFYLAGDDLSADTDLSGLIAFFFACYGAGTPKLDEFAKQAFKDERSAIAPYPFIADLPTRMLNRPKGGALAVIGHVERAWGYSFSWPGAGPQTGVFTSTLHRLLEGHPVGSAMEYFSQRYAELSTLLVDELEELEFGADVDPYELSGLWTANNDARGYVIIGDPAVRLQVAG